MHGLETIKAMNNEAVRKVTPQDPYEKGSVIEIMDKATGEKQLVTVVDSMKHEWGATTVGITTNGEDRHVVTSDSHVIAEVFDKKFFIPVTWEMHKVVEVEANSLEEAMQAAIDSIVPSEGDYVHDSAWCIPSDAYDENGDNISSIPAE